MEIKKINSESMINLEEQFDVDLQYFWCDCDCGVEAPKKDKSTIKVLKRLIGSEYVKNPSSAKQKEGKSLANDIGETYCYCTGTKKTSKYL